MPCNQSSISSWAVLLRASLPTGWRNCMLLLERSCRRLIYRPPQSHRPYVLATRDCCRLLHLLWSELGADCALFTNFDAGFFFILVFRAVCLPAQLGLCYGFLLHCSGLDKVLMSSTCSLVNVFGFCPFPPWPLRFLSFGNARFKAVVRLFVFEFPFAIPWRGVNGRFLSRFFLLGRYLSIS